MSSLSFQVFKLKENVYITEFELSVDYCFNCMAAVLSDSSAIYIISDSTNAFRGLVAKVNDRNLIYKCLAINPLYKIVVFGCKKYNLKQKKFEVHLSIL